MCHRIRGTIGCQRILSHYLVRDGVTYNYTQLRWKDGKLKTEGESWNVKKGLVVK
ncbi:MAG: hypothetical protein IJP82_08200 [Bacteroidaceae bacterium]|nr:hypothetical protein [Bacteroidaceae bacterium]